MRLMRREFSFAFVSFDSASFNSGSFITDSAYLAGSVFC